MSQRRRSMGCMWVGVVVLLGGGCASDKGAQGGQPGGGAEVPGVAVSATPEELEQALLDCARLTFASTETNLVAHVWLNQKGRLTGLTVDADGGAAPTLMCPSDRALSAVVLGAGGGKTWGASVAVGTDVEAYCGAGLDENTAGCSSRVQARVARASATASRSTTRAAPAGGTPESSPDVTATWGRAPSPLHFRVTRLGTDLPEGTTLNIDSQMSQLDYAVHACLHSRQPDVGDKMSLDMRVAVLIQDRSRFASMPMAIRGTTPAGLDGLLLDCLQRVSGGDAPAADGTRFVVTYTAVASPAERPVGAYMQEVVVETGGDRVGISVSSEARKALGRKVQSVLHGCLTSVPMERAVGKAGWTPLPGMEIRGTLDAHNKERLSLHRAELLNISSRDGLPPWLEPHARCVKEAFPDSNPELAAEASWEFTGSVRILLE